MNSKKLNYSSPGLWHDKEEAWSEVVPKVHRRVLANSQAATLALFRLDAGAVISTHSHPHAQHGVCLEGRGEFTIGDHTWKVSRNDSWFIPPGLPHEYRNDPNMPGLIIEVFTPQREEYAPDVA
jgi:quercetin dioxygenase-like cupin family protein